MKPMAIKVFRHLSSTLYAFVALCVGTMEVQAVPQLINFQGRVQVEGVDFSGLGAFRFALVDEGGSTTYWSNDGSSTAGSQPASAVSVTVTSGLYSVLLGNATIPNMSLVPASVFANDDVFLRIWFDDGSNGSQLLTPDQRIAAVGYAMMAANAASAETVPDGAITSAKVADGAITASKLQAGAIGPSQLADGVITTEKIGDGAITTDKLSSTVAIPNLQSGTAIVPGTIMSGTYPFEVTFPVPYDNVPVLLTRWGKDDYRITDVTATGLTGEVDLQAGDGTTVVDTNPGEQPAGGPASVLTLDGRPAICYTSSEGVRFVINSESDAGGTWTATTVDTGQAHSMALINGKPAISYAKDSKLTLAINEQADGSGAWNKHVAGPVGVANSSLAEVGGKPMIAFVLGPLQDIGVTVSTDPDGSGPWTPTNVTTANGTSLALIGVNNRPIMICYSVFGTRIFTGSNADGSGSWTSVPGNVKPDVIFSHAGKLWLVEGPIFGGVEGRSHGGGYQTNSMPDGSGTWTQPIPLPGVTAIYRHAIIDGKLAFLVERNGLPFVAINSESDGSGTWEFSAEVAGPGEISHVADVAGKLAVTMLGNDLLLWQRPGVGNPAEVEWIVVGP